MIGAGDGIRTRDINLGKVALYQLSYSRREAPTTVCHDFVAEAIHVIATSQVIPIVADGSSRWKLVLVDGLVCKFLSW